MQTLKLGVALGALMVPVAIGGQLPASAGPADHGVVVSADPVDWTPDVENTGFGTGVGLAKVRATARVGDVTVAVGDFSEVTDKVTGETLAREDIFAFDDEGRVLDSFAPSFTGSSLFDVIPAADGKSVFVAGAFRRVNGLPGTARLVKLDVATGEVVRTFQPPGISNRTVALHLAKGRLYVGGAFSKVGGKRHTSLMAVNPRTGRLTNHLNLRFARTWNGGTLGVTSFAMTPDGSRLVAIGNFRRVEGKVRPQIVMIDTSRRRAVLAPWATRRFAKGCAEKVETYMNEVDSSPDGKYFVVVTTGAWYGGANKGVLCDTTSRWEFGTTGGRRQPTWVNYSGGDTMTSVEVTDVAVYIGGHFRWMNNPYVHNKRGAGAIPRWGLAALDPRNGMPFTWNPTRLRGWGVYGLRASDQGLWLGHDTDELGNEERKRIGLFPLVDGMGLPADSTGSLPGRVVLLRGSEAVVHTFSGLAVTGSATLDSTGLDGSAVRGAFMVDNMLYTGWSDGTMTRQVFNGTRFGGPVTLNLYGNTAFQEELPNIRAMWFDRRTARMYFTLKGDAELYYRYFLPESRAVGAVRFRAPDSSSIKWNRVTSGFLANGKLYYRTFGGNLHSARWSAATGASGGTRISGPSLDGVDWSSGALFLDTLGGG